MSEFLLGNKVIKLNSEQHGIIVEVMPACRGRQLYKVNWGNGIITDELEVNLRQDCNISNPYERCASGIFGSYSDYSQKNTTYKIYSSNNSTISSLKASKTLFRAYQFKPLLKFLNSPNRRLLVADEVGLGKTIEAGHIMLELKARRELNHVLIVCPKSLQQKWKDELDFKFGLSFKIYDEQIDLINDIKEHRVAIHGIINYEKIRLRKLTEDIEEQTDKKGKRKKKQRELEPDKNLIDYLSLNEFKFSLILCDEAHKMRNSQTQTYKGAEILLSQTDAALFLTATPVMISTENLYNLLHLLDNTRYYNYQIFDNRLEENRPFVYALSNLNINQPLLEIAQNLDSSEITIRYYSNENEIYSETTTIAHTFKENPLYNEIQRLLHCEDTTKTRARLQYLLSSISVMNSIFSRTRKREVTTDMSQAQRVPHKQIVELTEREREEFDEIINQYFDDNSYIDNWGEERLSQRKVLGLIQKKRQIASSVYAYLNSEENLDKGIDAYASFPDAKINELLRIINEVFKHGTKKIVIFALFRKTLKYLQIRLKKAGLGSLMIHGLINNRQEILDNFKNDSDSHILLSSEVGSEGLDMQFCNSMVNYDLPWNPMVVEQRIGRIDRFGQKAKVVNIYNMVVSDSIQEDIYVRLLERIGIFKGTIGDMEAILDAPFGDRGQSIQDVYNQLEKQLYVSKLTQEEINRKISEIELAIANEKENIKRLEEGLDTALTNDAYFKNEINRIQNNNAYVTEYELRNYLETAIRQELTTCTLVEIKDNIFELQISPSTPNILKNFLTRYQPNGEENDVAFRHFKNEINGVHNLQMTFNQEMAYENNKLLFINIYHPIIQACLMYFRQKEDFNSTTFCYALKSNNKLSVGSAYFLGIYKVKVMSQVMGVNKITETLLPLLYDANNRKIIDNEDFIDYIFAQTQQNGIEHNPENTYINNELLQNIRYDFAETILNKENKQRHDILLELESNRIRNEQQTIEYYNSIIKNQENFIKGWENDIQYNYDNEKRITQLKNTIRLAQERIKKYEQEKEDKLYQISEKPKIDITEEIISLNLIKII